MSLVYRALAWALGRLASGFEDIPVCGDDCDCGTARAEYYRALAQPSFDALHGINGDRQW